MQCPETEDQISNDAEEFAEGVIAIQVDIEGNTVTWYYNHKKQYQLELKKVKLEDMKEVRACTFVWGANVVSLV